jgi:hypothetical protein
MTKELVIEAIINYAFLATGRIDRVDNVKGTDMLSNFAFAGSSLHKHMDEQLIAKASPIMQVSGPHSRSVVPDVPRWVSNRRKWR